MESSYSDMTHLDCYIPIAISLLCDNQYECVTNTSYSRTVCGTYPVYSPRLRRRRLERDPIEGGILPENELPNNCDTHTNNEW